MRQRVGIARALAMDPQVLLLDEPFGALDALTRATLQDELARIWQQDRKTVVMITNDVDEGILLADRIIPLRPGPGATLGPGLGIDLPRPRHRTALNHNDEFRSLRREITEYLLQARGHQNAMARRNLVLPDLEPEDLSVPRNSAFWNRAPRRRKASRCNALEVTSE
jgi:nitrate/nitrite transport system ATP-binding protein